MKRRVLGKKKGNLEVIKEGEISDIEIEKIEEDEERFEFCGYDEEEIEINRPKSRLFKPVLACALGLSLVAASPEIVNTKVIEPNSYVVEAKTNKKDTKKPVIKLSGKNTIEVEKDKTVKIPKVTAKDNRDGNVTKKIKVTVKKGKKSYSKIAKAIKNNKNTKFTSIGTYKITYTVKDKAGNKASKTRSVKVVNAKKKDPVITTTEITTTQNNITEVPTTKEITTETPTTEKVTTETPTTEKPYVFKELPEPIVGDNDWEWHTIKLNNETYYIVNDPDWFDFESVDKYLPENKTQIKFNIQNDYEYIMLSRDSGQIGNAEYLKYIGGISAVNENGKILTPYDDMTIYSPFNKNNVKDGPNNVAYIYIKGSSDPENIVLVPVYLNIVEFDKNKNYDENSFKDQGYELLSKEPLVYGKRRSYSNVNSLGTAKTLDLGVTEN